MTNQGDINHPKPDPTPSVSFIIPTLNSERTLQECLQSIREQTYCTGDVEIIIADAGSTDNTLAIAKEFDVDKIVTNPLKTGESGKTAGIEASSGDVIALIDSDNILDGPEWLTKMLVPFSDPEIIASEPIFYIRRDEDPGLTRYFAMLGMNDPLCLFLGNYDRQSMITGKWTELSLDEEDRGSYLKLTLTEDQLPTIGANGFVFRRKLLDSVTWKPYFFDIDIPQQAITAGYRHMAKVKCGIVHLYCESLKNFARKQDRRIKDFLFFSQEKHSPGRSAPCSAKALRGGESAEPGRSYPWNRQRRLGIIHFCIDTLLVVPLLIQMVRGWLRKKDPAWLFHLPACWITLWVYGVVTVKKMLRITPKPRSRTHWQK